MGYLHALGIIDHSTITLVLNGPNACGEGQSWEDSDTISLGAWEQHGSVFISEMGEDSYRTTTGVSHNQHIVVLGSVRSTKILLYWRTNDILAPSPPSLKRDAELQYILTDEYRMVLWTVLL
jgi:hypothetical protein